MAVVAILGASPKPERYAFRAQAMLRDYGHVVVPINPAFAEVSGEQCSPSIRDVAQPIDTVTVYLGEARSTPLTDDLIAAKPRRIILNPGAENEALASSARAAGIDVVEGCTLVMLRAGTF